LRRNHPYYVNLTFEHASKIQEGTPVRMKGVQVGSISQVSVYPSHVEVVAEVMDSHNVIPLASRVDINQLGLAADPFVDITPPAACPTGFKKGPHDPGCDKEGFIVCNGGKLSGSQGGSMDYMMKVYLKRQDYSRVKVVEGDYRQ
jgi:ABC-type transporter Mla subunit MlaD